MNKSQRIKLTKRIKVLYFYPFLIIIFFFQSNLNCQENSSPAYKDIIENELLTEDSKIRKIDSLLQLYKDRKEYEKLFDDIYSYGFWYFLNGKYEKAIDICKKGLGFANKFDNPDPDRFGGLKNTIGSSYLITGNYEEAFKVYEDITKTVEIDRRIAMAYNYMALCKKNQGDYYDANDYFELSTSKAKNLEDKSYHIEFVINETSNYDQILNKKLKQKGVRTLKRILNLVKTDSNYKKALSPIYKVLIHQKIGSLQLSIDDKLLSEAELNYKEALNITKNHDDLNEQKGAILNALGYIRLKRNQPESLDYLEDALIYIKNPETKSICYSNIALHYANNNLFDSALQNANYALNLLLKFDLAENYAVPRIDDLRESIYKHELLTAMIEKAEIFMMKHNVSKHQKDLNSAFELLTLSDQLVDIIRLESDATESKLFWRNMTSRIYGNMVEICHKLNKANEAFSYIEKNKALLLLEDITQKKYFNSGNVPKDLITTYSNLKDDIRSQTELLNSQEKAKQDSTRAQLINSKTRLTYFLDSIQNTKYGGYFKNNKLTNILSLKDIQKSLEDNQSNISYILNEKSGYGLVITKNNYRLFKINNVDSLNRLTRRFQKFLLQPLNSKTEQDNFYSTSRRLYSLLLPTEIQSLIKDKSLLISADYYLQNLAFEALIDNSEKYLIENHIINYSYSSSFLETNAKIKREPTKDFIGFAPINFSNGLNRLKRTEQEIEAISNSFNGDNYYFDHADSKTFKNSINDYNIIHLATHANANDSIRPWIALHDKLITLDELYLTNNSAELVVLSACETGLGEIKQGEGVMSLARGFFNNGANSVVSSLWNVNDKSGTDIMTNFYKNLASGDSKSLALQKAKIDYINTSKLSQKSPYYWASFILIGDPSPIKNTSNSWLYILIALSIISFIFILFKRKHKILG